MKATRLPVLLPVVTPPARKVSGQHLDTLFNALILILNLDSVEYMSTDLVAILTSMHNQLISRLDIDAAATISLYKQLASYFLSYVRGVRLPQSSFRPEDWSLLHNCPQIFVELLPWYDTWLQAKKLDDRRFWLHIQVIYAFLSGHRVIVTPMNINLSTITAHSSVDPQPEFNSYHESATKALGITPDEFQRVFKSFCAKAQLKVVTTAGPNGQATWTAHEDAVAISASGELLHSIHSWARKTGLEWIFSCMFGTVQAPASLSGNKSQAPIHSKLHAIEEWGGKTRIVAIMDYWTQMFLTPLHDTVAHFLKRLDNDGTFDQNRIIAKVKDWTLHSQKGVYSYDLTAATDTIPIKHQTALLGYLLGDADLAGFWENIMTNRSFQAPDGSFVRYAVGQPMGAKSSFPMLGLIHHFFVQVAAQKANVTGYKDYVILGDDNTMATKDVASNYLTVMESIGVPINLSKSVYSQQGLLTAGEICKRIFVAGRELTAIPVKLIVKANRFGHLISALQAVVEARNWPVRKDLFIEFAAGIVDKKSLQGIILLNSLPTEITGFKDRCDIPSDFSITNAWSKKNAMDCEEFLRAYTYALVTEQLKRVDQLLKGTILMAETIAAMANPDPAKVWPTALFDHLTPEQKTAKMNALPALNWTHPICIAAQNELDRVLGHLSGLRSGTKATVTLARRGLLDSLRNSLHEMWLGEAEKSAAVTRSVLNSMFGAVGKLLGRMDKDPKDNTLTFSVLLSQVQRMWTIHWQYRSDVRINAVKSKVNINVSAVKTTVSSAVEKFSVSNFRL